MCISEMYKTWTVIFDTTKCVQKNKIKIYCTRVYMVSLVSVLVIGLHCVSVDSNQLQKTNNLGIYLTQISSVAVRFVVVVVIVTGIRITGRALALASESGAESMCTAGGWRCRIISVVFLRKFCGFCLCVSTIRISNKIIILHTYID